MAPLALTAVSLEYRLYSKLLSSADNKSQQAFLGCKYSHSVCQLTLSHIVFYILYIKYIIYIKPARKLCRDSRIFWQAAQAWELEVMR